MYAQNYKNVCLKILIFVKQTDRKVFNYENVFFYSVQISLVEKPNIKIISFQKQNQRYLNYVYSPFKLASNQEGR